MKEWKWRKGKRERGHCGLERCEEKGKRRRKMKIGMMKERQLRKIQLKEKVET